MTPKDIAALMLRYGELRESFANSAAVVFNLRRLNEDATAELSHARRQWEKFCKLKTELLALGVEIEDGIDWMPEGCR